MIAIIDYDAGNLGSVKKALAWLGHETQVTRDRRTILSADQVILPGVGAYGDAMKQLEKYDLIGPLREAAASGIPLLGICLGMQLLFDGSEENGGVEGTHILPGEILALPEGGGRKIPHMGWNSLEVSPGAKLFAETSAEPFVYFVHSYYLHTDRRDIVAATTEYGVTVDASVESGSVFGCQFHPEKSSREGMAILRAFAGQNGKGEIPC